MTTFYGVCAVIGGTVLLVQFVMTLIGMGDSDGAIGDVDHDALLDGGHDVGADSSGVDGHGAGHGSSWLFGVITFRTMVAAITFFGLAGLASQANDMDPMAAFFIALGAGGAAMYAVFWMMQGLYRMRSDGTVRVNTALGRTGTVYIRIPAERRGQGKIQLNLQNQTIELQAVTQETRELPTGATIVVTQIVGPDTVEVALAG